MSNCLGIAHATLTVSNINQTKKFYETLFDTSFTLDNSRVFSLIGIGVPIWFVQRHINKADRFDEKRIGLDHIAIAVKSKADLEEVELKLHQLQVANQGIEFFAGKYPYIAFRDPDNIQTEFFVVKGKND